MKRSIRKPQISKVKLILSAQLLLTLIWINIMMGKMFLNSFFFFKIHLIYFITTYNRRK